MGIETTEAARLARECGSSSTIFQRRRPAIDRQEPDWCRDDALRRTMIPALLAGGWDSGNEEDRRIVGRLAREDYEAFEARLHPCLRADDSPVAKIGDVWTLVAPPDSFELLARNVTQRDLTALREVALTVFSEVDPALDLPPEERPYANLKGKTLRHSPSPRRAWPRSGVGPRPVEDDAAATRAVSTGDLAAVTRLTFGAIRQAAGRSEPVPGRLPASATVTAVSPHSATAVDPPAHSGEGRAGFPPARHRRLPAPVSPAAVVREKSSGPRQGTASFPRGGLGTDTCPLPPPSPSAPRPLSLRQRGPLAARPASLLPSARARPPIKVDLTAASRCPRHPLPGPPRRAPERAGILASAACTLV
jgi:hypothetical protein